MLKNISATRKGLITGVLMIALYLLLFYSKVSFENPLQFSIYLLYAAGIVWAVYDFSLTAEATAKFGAYFTQAFKCFIVVTLLMVVFTFIFVKLHPEFLEKDLLEGKQFLLKEGNTTPAEIEKRASSYKSIYMVGQVFMATIRYLLPGAIISVIISFLFMRRK